MANLKEIRTRINSVQSTRKITNAMKMVAASKLKKAQDAVINLRPYDSKLHEILFSLVKSLEGEEISSRYLRNGKEEKVLLVVITSNKGLCGAFNSNIVKKGVELAQSKYSEQYKNGNLFYFTIGKKGTDFFTSKEYQVYDYNNDILEDMSFKNAFPVIKQVMDSYINGAFDKIEIIYNKFKNAAVQLLTVDQFLPVDLHRENGEESEEQYNFIFEPSKEFIIRELIPKTLRTQFYEALLESLAAEHGARMTAMHKATDNATEMIRDLQLTYNKARQASITSEILEVVSGAEALKE
ncbi:MAG: ATP synthase F1 subunit gamma [Bacteroidales bacterium]|nr:ATP synthase F1 subunit gamma [Bacteroidales bacterium]